MWRESALPTAETRFRPFRRVVCDLSISDETMMQGREQHKKASMQGPSPRSQFHGKKQGLTRLPGQPIDRPPTFLDARSAVGEEALARRTGSHFGVIFRPVANRPTISFLCYSSARCGCSGPLRVRARLRWRADGLGWVSVANTLTFFRDEHRRPTAQSPGTWQNTLAIADL